MDTCGWGLLYGIVLLSTSKKVSFRCATCPLETYFLQSSGEKEALLLTWLAAFARTFQLRTVLATDPDTTAFGSKLCFPCRERANAKFPFRSNLQRRAWTDVCSLINLKNESGKWKEERSIFLEGRAMDALLIGGRPVPLGPC